MTRTQLFFFILLSCILHTGCTKDDMLRTEEQHVKAYMQVYMPRAGVQSRTINSPGIPGTREESLISDLTVYLVNGNEQIKFDHIDILNRSESFISALIPIRRDMLNQEYQLFVVANPQKADLSLRNTADFKGLYSSQTNTYKLITPEQMVMSNQVEQSPLPTVIITPENTRDNPAKATVKLDRLAVKIVPQISVDFKANFADRPRENAFFQNYTFTVEAAGLLNGATEFNLEQQWSSATNGEAIQLLSPTWYYQPEELYFTRYYNTINDYTGTSNPPFVTVSEQSENGYYLLSSPLYCLENNSPFYDYTGSDISLENQLKTKYKGLATGVVFKMRATKNNEVASFYRYKGHYYSDTETDKYALAEAAELQPADFNNIPGLREKGIKVYEDGVIYYTYWIKDENPAYSGEDYDLSYAVIRNSYYLLNILGLTNIGDDIPGGGYEPDEPIDKIEQIEVVAVCQDWTLVDVTHEFN